MRTLSSLTVSCGMVTNTISGIRHHFYHSRDNRICAGQAVEFCGLARSKRMWLRADPSSRERRSCKRLMNRCDDFRTKAAEGLALFNHQQHPRTFDRVHNRPVVQRIDLDGADDLRHQFMLVEEFVCSLLRLVQRTAIADDRHVRCSLRTNASRGEILIRVLGPESGNCLMADILAIHRLVLDHDGWPVDGGEEPVVNEMRIEPRMQRQYLRPRQAEEMFLQALAMCRAVTAPPSHRGANDSRHGDLVVIHPFKF